MVKALKNFLQGLSPVKIKKNIKKKPSASLIREFFSVDSRLRGGDPKKIPGSGWRTPSKNKTKKILKQCELIYKNTKPFQIAQKARKQENKHSYEYLYGEINFSSFAFLLSQCNITPNMHFYDLGSGAGKAVICAALLYNFAKATGIEHLNALHECAKNRLPIAQQKENNIIWLQGDFLQKDFDDADLVFINATGFMGDAWQHVLAKLSALQQGTQIIITSKLLPEQTFTQTFCDDVLMSWGYARVSIYQKN